MKILSCDTSSKIASVAVTKDGEIKCEVSINMKRQHSKILMPMIEYAIKSSDMKISEIDRFASCIGPGSFTGIRIAISSLNAMALSLNKEIVGVTSLDLLVYGTYTEFNYTIGMIHARNNQIYAGIYKKGCLVGDYYAGSVDDFLSEIEKIDEQIFFVGDATAVFFEKIKKAAKRKAIFAPERYNFSSARNIGFIAENMKAVQKTIEPLYLKKSQAERYYNQKKN